jgi:hypothetical protein
MGSDSLSSSADGAAAISSSLAVTKYAQCLEKQLCFIDGYPTHGSSGRQRQCPKCKERWSYHHRRIEFRGLEGYCLGLSAADVASRIQCAKNTAQKYFRRFGEAMELLIANLLEKERIGIRPVTQSELISLERALRENKRRLRSRSCHHLFIHSLKADDRLRLLFENTIGGDLRRMQLVYFLKTKLAEIETGGISNTPPYLPTGKIYCRSASDLNSGVNGEDERAFLNESRLVPGAWKAAFKKLRTMNQRCASEVVENQ